MYMLIKTMWEKIISNTFWSYTKVEIESCKDIPKISSIKQIVLDKSGLELLDLYDNLPILRQLSNASRITLKLVGDLRCRLF